MSYQYARMFERFDLKAPAFIKSSNHNGIDHHLLLTRDISNGGAYFNTMESVRYQGHVQVELLFEVTNDDNRINYVYMTVSGEVVRHDESGLAVSFNEDSTLMPFNIN